MTQTDAFPLAEAAECSVVPNLSIARMDLEDWQGDQGPVFTGASSSAISFHGYSTCDHTIEIGVVIIHPDSGRFLVFEESDGLHRLPTRRLTQDMASALQNPLETFHEETGYKLERLALRKLAKRMQGLESDSYYDLHAETVLLGEKSTNAFHFTLDSRWVPDEEGEWTHPTQVVTFWFAGIITDGPVLDGVPRSLKVARRTGCLVSLETADELLGRDNNFSHQQGLHIFHALWKNRSAPNGVLALHQH